MPLGFDPYYTWLGIPPEEQPPDHYRLLGLRPFEENLEVIENAADQRMAHLHTLQTGKRGKSCQRLLNEVAAARVCLLNPGKKAAYDRQLRKILQAEVADGRKPQQAGRDLSGQATVPFEPGSAGEKSAGKTATESTAIDQLGEYQVLEKLGQGGMGAVYKALHTKLGREVALKVLPKSRIEDERAIARFEREMMAVGAVDHPNIVRAMDAREIEGTWFLVMEFVDGMDLGKLVRRLGPLPVADACELIRQAALGLQSAHEHGLVHRDVKPSNLMLTQQGQVKLLDLGLARFQSDQPSGEEMTATGQAVGTIDYMAPEQISDTHGVDIRADIYSLGCTLYKLLTGRAPFSGPKYQSTFEKMKGHLEKPALPIRHFRSDVPEGLDALIDRMMAKDPADRYATPAEAADAIGSLATGSDLPSLLARAKGKPTPAVKPSEAFAATQEAHSASAALTRFFQGLKAEPREPAVQLPVADEGRRARLAIILGSAALGTLLLAILIVCVIKSDSGLSANATALVFDWPEGEREETTLFIDRIEFRFPASGRLEVPCKPGEHRIHAVREGFKPYHEVIKVKAGQSMEISPVWLPQSYLVLQWPVDQRRNAKLEIDGQVPDVSDPAIEATPDQIKVPMEAGLHKVWIARRGFESFAQIVQIVEGKSLSVSPVWAAAPAEVEPKRKLPVPGNDVQQEIAEKIGQEYNVADAKSGPDKVTLARKLLDLGRQAQEDPNQQFGLLRKAMQLATDAGDAGLMLEAAGAIGADFELDLPEVKRKAFAQLVRTAPDSSEIGSVVEAADQVMLGDAYWDLAETSEEEAKTSLMLRARHWYKQAQPKVASAAIREKLTQRLEQIAATEAAEAAVARAQREAARREARYANALETSDALVAAWDFRGAAAALAKLRFDEEDLAARLATRRNEVQHLAKLKTRMITKINTAKPLLKKNQVQIRGINGDLIKANEDLITARLISGKTESHPWQSLSQDSVQQFLRLVIDRNRADDHLAAGLLTLACKDATTAEKHFEKARSLGAQIEPYLAPLVASAFAQATEMLKKKRFLEADAVLRNIEKKSAQTAWFTSNKNAFDTALAKAKAGMLEAEAEELYAQAAKLHRKEQLFDLKPLVDRLRSDYAQTRLVTDTYRKPSLAEMEKAVAGLGRFITVRQDAKGEFTSIQEAIDSAPPNSLIEIQDNGPYYEKIHIPRDKPGMTLRGSKGCWPLVRSGGPLGTVEHLVVIDASQTTIECLAIAHVDCGGAGPICLMVAGSSRLRSVLWGGASYHRIGPDSEIENCCAAGVGNDLGLKAPTVVQNSIFLNKIFGFAVSGRGKARLENVVAPQMSSSVPTELRFCTIPGLARFGAGETLALDSILGSVVSHKPGNTIDFCDVVSGKYVELARQGRQCFSADPKFSDPKNFNYTLMPISPCRNKASDGGDLGVRYTPEMIEILRLVLDLRKQGIFKF